MRRLGAIAVLGRSKRLESLALKKRHKSREERALVSFSWTSWYQRASISMRGFA